MPVNMTKALNSPRYAREIWVDYYYRGNVQGTTAAEIGSIVTTWRNQIAGWKNYAESDHNEYEIDESSYNDYVQKGREAARDVSGYRNSFGQRVYRYGRPIGDAIGSTAGRYFIQKGISKFSNKFIGKVAEEGAKEAVGKYVASSGLKGAAATYLTNVGNGAATKIGEVAGNAVSSELSGKATQLVPYSSSLEKAGLIKTGESAETVIASTVKDSSGEIIKDATEKTIADAADKVTNVAMDSPTTLGSKFGEKGTEELIDKTATVAKDTAEKEIGQVTDAAVQGAQDAAVQGGTEGAAKATNWSIILSCAMDVASTVIYNIKKPNKAEHDAVNTYASNMESQQALTMNTQYDMQDMNATLADSADEAFTINDTANDNMSKQRTEYGMYEQYLQYCAKAQTRGYEFSEDELKTREEYLAQMKALGMDIMTEESTAKTEVADIRADMADFEVEYDAAAENIGMVNGFTEEAASIDESTKTMCYVEAAAQGVSAGVAAWDAAKAFVAASASSWCGIGLAYAASGALAAGAAIFDGKAVAEQIGYANDIGGEIQARNLTENMNNMTAGVYDESVDDFGMQLDTVDGLELIVPDDVDPSVYEGQDGNDKGKKKKP